MKRTLLCLLAATFLGALPAPAQTAPEIAFDAVASPLNLPDDIYLGEVGGVATNSKGDVFVYTRTGHPTGSLGGARGSIAPASSSRRSQRTPTPSCSPSRCASIRRTTSGSSTR